jgi:ABC-type Na+ efflux pump permease subunit
MIALFGKIVAYIGLLITVVGLALGFGLMFQGDNDELAKFFLMSIPFGFVILFTGFATVIMFSPRESELKAAQQKESKNSVDRRMP